jgi:hypothetical protein
MATVAELMAGGCAAPLARRIGADPSVSLAATGTNQATAAAITSNFTLISTAPASTGVVLRAAGGQAPTIIYNGGGSTLQIYGNGSDKINGIAGSTGISVPTLKCAILIANGNQWGAIVSA